MEMAKPRAEQQPAEWTEELKTQIATALGNQPAIDVLWSWDNLVKIACTKVGSDLTSVAASVVDGTQHGLADGLKASMQKLTHAQGEGDLSKATAPHHLSTALTGLLADQLEHPGNLGEIAPHSDWLSAEQPAVALGNGFAARMNGLLVASDVPPSEIFFVPGTVYTVTGKNLFKKLTGRELGDFFKFCCSKKEEDKIKEWAAAVRQVFVDISPACDVAQRKRVTALLVAGLVVPSAMRKFAKPQGSVEIIPGAADFRMRWPTKDFPEQDAFLMVCHTYKVVAPEGVSLRGIQPWFRLREIPTASIRNANASHAARVGFVSVS